MGGSFRLRGLLHVDVAKTLIVAGARGSCRMREYNNQRGKRQMKSESMLSRLFSLVMIAAVAFSASIASAAAVIIDDFETDSALGGAVMGGIAYNGDREYRATTGDIAQVFGGVFNATLSGSGANTGGIVLLAYDGSGGAIVSGNFPGLGPASGLSGVTINGLSNLDLTVSGNQYLRLRDLTLNQAPTTGPSSSVANAILALGAYDSTGSIFSTVVYNVKDLIDDYTGGIGGIPFDLYVPFSSFSNPAVFGNVGAIVLQFSATQGSFANASINSIETAPEPGTMIVWTALAFCGFGAARRKRRKVAA